MLIVGNYFCLFCLFNKSLAIGSHGYCRWTEICSDPAYGIINIPFEKEGMVTMVMVFVFHHCVTFCAEITVDYKSRFLLKRFRVSYIVH